MFRRHIAAGAGLLLAINCYAQQLAYRHFSTNEGLPHPQIYMTKTGPDGSLWIGTDNGLSRFDGNRFHNYYPKHAAGTNYILDMDSLPGGLMLVNVYKGGLCLIRNDSIIRLNIDMSLLPVKMAPLDGRLYSITYDPVNRCIWTITNSRELFRMVLTGNRLVVNPLNTDGISCYSIYFSRKRSAVFFATTKGLLTYAPGKQVHPVSDYSPAIPVFRVFEKGENEFILGLQDGVMRFNQHTGEKVTTRYSRKILRYDRFLYDEKQQLLWIPGFDGGIFIFRETELQRPYLHILKGTTPNFLYADSDNNIWCSTYGSGLYLFQQTYILNYHKEEGLDDSYVTHIAFGKDPNPYVSCLYSFYRFNLSAHYLDTVFKTGVTGPYNKSITLQNGQQLFINAGKIMNSNGKELANTRSVIYDIRAYNPDTLLFSNYSGLRMLNSAYQEITTGTPEPKANIFMIGRKGDSLLLASAKGLFIHILKRKSLVQYNEKNGLGDGYIHTVLVHNDTIYCGTRTGLYAIDKNGQVTHCWKDILADEDINHISSDSRGGIWIGTQKGLYLQYNNRLYHFDMHDGFVASEITFILARGSQLYVGTTQGLSVADLEHLYENLGTSFRPRLPEIEKMIINGREVIPLPGEELKLQPGENNLAILIKLVQFNPRPLTVLEYSLDNGENWAPVVNREISLKSLNYGSYSLLVRTRHRNETVNYYMTPFRFSIALPWYRNALVIIGVSLALSAFGIWLYNRTTRNRRKQERQQLALKKQMLDLEQKAMAALLNPHFVFNAINSINYYINNGEEEKYTRLLTDLSKLIRLNLNNTYKDSVTLKSELEIVQLYVAFEKHRFIRQPLQFDIINDSKTLPEQVKIPSMIIQPFVENAIWHGLLPKNGGRVWLHIKDASAGYLLVEIHDDGVGMAPAETKTPGSGVRGIQLIQERISAYNQLNKYPIKLFIPGNEATSREGFFVRLFFPLQQEPA